VASTAAAVVGGVVVGGAVVAGAVVGRVVVGVELGAFAGPRPAAVPALVVAAGEVG
jgi:hypothetical protein